MGVLTKNSSEKSNAPTKEKHAKVVNFSPRMVSGSKIHCIEAYYFLPFKARHDDNNTLCHVVKNFVGAGMET